MAGKNASMNALALSSFWVQSSEPTRSAGTQPHVSRGFMYVAAFQSFPSPASSRNCFQCEDLAFSMVLVHARRFCCIASKAVVVLACSLPSSAQFACHLLRSWLTSTCWVFRSGVNHRLEYGVGRVSGVNRSTAWAVAAVRFSTTRSSVGRVLICFHGFICRTTSSPILAQSARSYAFLAFALGLV
ncbi:unnamed protein product [Penicillium salamii]|uniref:Uncharacterized protein n=1 Tax=Penicillium salamii TaxID=1612424 RepID=A0A9W4IBC3_9EURO|nr:unnamed protein product [Penicillium salamii]